MSQPYTSNTEVSQDDKLWALLSYILTPIVPLIILLFMQDKKDRPFLRYHYMQALVIGVIGVILGVTVVGACLVPFLWIYAIYLGIKAYQGDYIVVPFLTDFMRKQNWV